MLPGPAQLFDAHETYNCLLLPCVYDLESILSYITLIYLYISITVELSNARQKGVVLVFSVESHY